MQITTISMLLEEVYNWASIVNLDNDSLYHFRPLDASTANNNWHEIMLYKAEYSTDKTITQRAMDM